MITIRYRPPGVIPLELWDLVVNGRILWEIMPDAEFPGILSTTIKALRGGKGETRSEGPVPDVIAGFDSLYVAGGRSREPRIRCALQALELPVRFSPTPDHPGRAQALRVLAGLGHEMGWVCDLGQVSFKISSGRDRRQFRRDFQRLPVRAGRPEKSVREQRRQLRTWLSQSLRDFSTEAAAPDGIFFALPSRLDDAGLPEGSSYIGLAEDGALVGDVLEAAGLNPRRVLVVNDAELAALDGLAEPALQECAKTLVLTLGFGPGAALAVRT